MGAANIAHWDGHSWSALGAGLPVNVLALKLLDLGTGKQLFAGGNFSLSSTDHGLAVWNGSGWGTVGGGTSYLTYGLASFTDSIGTQLYVTGEFASVGGGVPANNIARFDGTTWSSLGPGLDLYGGPMFAHYGVDGATLYVGGYFTHAGGVSANRVAAWDGTTWSALGSGLAYGISLAWLNSITEYDDGTGIALYVGGHFLTAGGLSAPYIARWKDGQWHSLGSGMNGDVGSLEVYDDGSGSKLYASGSFTQAGGVAAENIARWNGSTWEPVGNNDFVGGVGLRKFQLPDGRPALFAWGGFTSMGGTPSSCIAYWSHAPLTGDLNHDGSVDLTDLATLLAHYGETNAPPQDGDLNADGIVDLIDLTTLLAVYGTGCS